MPKTEAEIVLRFMSKVLVDEWGCWIWQGARSRGQGNKEWYGTFYIEPGRITRAHTYSHDTFKGKPPKGWHRDHQCREHGAPRDNSLCVNPRHIVAVSPIKNNMRRWRRDADSSLSLNGYHLEYSGWPGAGGNHQYAVQLVASLNGSIHNLAGGLTCKFKDETTTQDR